MIGTFSPQAEPYTHEMPEETTPSGMFARGQYSARSKVMLISWRDYFSLHTVSHWPKTKVKKRKKKLVTSVHLLSHCIFQATLSMNQLLSFTRELLRYCIWLKKWVNYKLDLTASLLILLSHYFGHLVKLNWCLVWIYQPTNKCSNKFDARLHVHTFNHSFKV